MKLQMFCSADGSEYLTSEGFLKVSGIAALGLSLEVQQQIYCVLQGLPHFKTIGILCISSFSDFLESSFLAQGNLNKRSKKAS